MRWVQLHVRLIMDNMYLQTMIKYFGRMLDFIYGEKEKEKEIKNIIEIFLFLNMKHKAIQCKQLYEDIKEYLERSI